MSWASVVEDTTVFVADRLMAESLREHGTVDVRKSNELVVLLDSEDGDDSALWSSSFDSVNGVCDLQPERDGHVAVRILPRSLPQLTKKV